MDETEQREAGSGFARDHERPAERDLRCSELFEYISDSVFLLDRVAGDRFRVAAFNPAAARLVGVTAGHAAGRMMDELFPDRAEAWLANYRRCAAAGHSITYQEVIPLPAGLRVFSTTLIPVKDAQGDCVRIIGIARDITAQVEAEAALKDSEERFRVAFATIPDAVNIGMVENGINYAVNAGFTRLTGWPESEAVGVSSTALNLWCDTAVRDALFRQLARDGYVREAEVRFRRRSGEEFNALLSSQTFTAGGKAYFLTVTQDITGRRRAERAQAAVYRIAEAANTSATLQDLLREIHGTVSELMPAPNFSIALYDAPSKTLSFPYYVDEHGRLPPPPAPPGRGLTEYVLRHGAPLLLVDPRQGEALVLAGEIDRLDLPAASWVGLPLRTQERTVGVLAAQIYSGSVRYGQRDLTLLQFVSTQVARAIERKQGEESLRESEHRFRALIQNSSDGILVVDATGIILFSSASVERLLGPGACPRGARVFELVHPEDRPGMEQEFAAMMATPGVPTTISARLRHADGSWRELEGVVANRLADPAVRGVVSNFRDVTDRKQMEARLMMADRMVSVGTLAAGVAHEINNPLSYVIANLDFSLGRLAGSQGGASLREVGEALREAQSGAQRVRAIVRDLKTFSRGDDLKQGAVDLERVLDATVNMAWNELRHRAQLVKDYAPEMPAVLGNESRLGQVFLNLLINAAQSIPEGAAQRNQVRLSTRVSGEHVIVDVRDTGAGIPAEHLTRLFDPFFTTKAVGVGTGLGLFICQNIVTALGGEIRVESEPGRGTTVHVSLRVARSPSDASPRPAAPAPAARARVLIIDDEPLIGTALLRLLPGHDVTVECAALPALARIRAGEIFDVILCDLMMPEMSGMALFERLREVAPALLDRVVFMTGGAFTAAAREFLDSIPNARLEKPLDLTALRALLSSSAGRS